MTFYCNGKKAFCTESECNDTCDYYNGEGGEYQHDLVKLKTNADRIRAMSDEELINLLSAPCPLKTRATDTGCAIPKPCSECIAEWLKQPAAEEVDDG